MTGSDQTVTSSDPAAANEATTVTPETNSTPVQPTSDADKRAPLKLTEIKPGGGGGGGMGSPSAVGATYSLDDTRKKIAFILLFILSAIIFIEAVGSAIIATNCWFFASSHEGACPAAQATLGILTTPLGTIFTAMLGLVGSVVGFYFGSQKQQ